MGIFFAAVFVCIVIGLGMEALRNLILRPKPPITTQEVAGIKVPMDLPSEFVAFLRALDNAGYIQPPTSDDLVMVRDPVFVEMLDKLQDRYDLLWLLPQMLLQLQKVDNEWVVCTTSHAIVFNRRVTP